MQGDDPPYLSVGTAVSAKYKGAFCEAKVSKVVRIVKCKVSYKMGLGNATVSDEQIRGTLRVGQLVQAKHPEKKEFVDATITKVQDCSQYTVVFDDGDITTLRRTALCLKSGRHFNESETLDQLPLTHPEHFGNPVVGGRRGRRSRQPKDDSSEGEVEEENEPDLEVYSSDIGRVVSVEASDKKKSKDNWFPGLVVMPSAQPTVRINVKDEFLVRSFKDGRYYTVPKKEVTEFTREMGVKVESSSLSEAVVKVLKYLDNDELPVHWEKNTLFRAQLQYSDSDDNYSDSSNDGSYEEKDHFVAQLYKFMDEAGTPLNKSPTIGNQDVDLYKLFKMVEKLGGYNRVTNQSKWRSLTTRLKFSNPHVNANQVKFVYKKFLLSYETFYRTLGVTMLNHPRTAKKNRGRSLIRDKDRTTTPINSPKPDDSDAAVEKKEEEKVEEKPKTMTRKTETKPKEDEKKRKESAEVSDTNSSDTTDHSEPTSSTSVRPKRTVEPKLIRDRKVRASTSEKVKVVVEKYEEPPKKDEKEKEKEKEKEEEKGQQTRSKSSLMSRTKEVVSPEVKKEKTPVPEAVVKPSTTTKIPVKKEDEKKRGRKRITNDDKTSHSDSSVTEPTPTAQAVNIGDKLKVYYGPTHESKVTYEAKVIEIDKDANGPVFLVHYTGWNTRYDEWIQPQRIAENLSATTKAKRLKHGSGTVTKSSTPKSAGKRGRGMSITGRSSIPDAPPRSTTPSSVTSSSSRTKSPATPATRATTSRVTTRQGRTRRTSIQTDASLHSESDSEVSESETEPDLSRTRSGGKTDESEGRSFRKKKILMSKSEKRKDAADEDTEKEEEVEKPKRLRKLRKSPDVKPTDDSDDDTGNPPKGRDFDLNQIRSELKGFVKVVKVSGTSDKDLLSSDDSNISPDIKQEVEEMDDKKENVADKSSSEDIYEFKEPEPFEFECAKLTDEKSLKKRLVSRLFDDVEKSPKKKPVKSPSKADAKEALEEKKRLKKTTPKKNEDSEDDEKKIEDPFDKLVESPSFQIVKSSEKTPPEKSKVVKSLILEESINLFKDIEGSMDEEGEEERLDISDNEESQGHPIFSHREDIFSESTFAKVSSDCISLGEDCLGFKGEQKKDSDDDDAIRASIQRVIAQTALTDEDSNDPLSFCSPSKKKVDVKFAGGAANVSKSEDEQKLKVAIPDSNAKEGDGGEASTSTKQISPALQETDSALMESICAQPELLTTKLDDAKDINVKTGTKIADSILQKFNMIKSKVVETKPPEVPNEDDDKKSEETKIETKDSDAPKTSEIKTRGRSSGVKSTPSKADSVQDVKKRTPRKVVSREFIDSDSDSSDSEQLVIAPSDEDSQTTTSYHHNKPDLKESDSNISFLQPATTDDSQSQDEISFPFDDVKIMSDVSVAETSSETKPEPLEKTKEEETDTQLHSMLLCEETIPGSPSSATEGTGEHSKGKSPLKEYVKEERVSRNLGLHEMPFASAPGSSNSKGVGVGKEKNEQVAFAMPPENRASLDANAVLDNTPPTTPESTMSNLSPRGENGDLSPNTGDNESYKSETECSYTNQRNTSNKMSPYCEEDTLLSGEPSASKKDPAAGACKKRRRSCKASEEVPAKRGRKPMNRSRQNSDSDDTSEHSVPGGVLIRSGSFDRIARSPRPSKYNFFVELDPALDSDQRITVLQQKLTDLRKTYADVKAELATIERRRKKIRRREREALKAAKQEIVCT